MLFKPDNQQLKITQRSKYAVNALTLLFLFAVGYSGYLIYQTKHNHNIYHSSLVDLIIRRQSTIEKLKDSDTAVQAAKQNAQYTNSPITVKKETIKENGERLAALNFFKEYVGNLAAGQNPNPTLSKYGTANFASQYKTLRSPKALLCGGDNLSNSAITIDGQVTQGAKTIYSVNFLDAKNQTLAEVQVGTVQQNGQYLVDSFSCRGPI